MKTIVSYLQLFPNILATVQSLEASIPLPSAGKQKLDLLLSIVKTAYDAEEAVRQEIPWEKLAPLVSAAANSIVSAFNALGLFKHPAAAH
jgi:hypothetical protein